MHVLVFLMAMAVAVFGVGGSCRIGQMAAGHPTEAAGATWEADSSGGASVDVTAPPDNQSSQEQDVLQVLLETTKGDILLEVHPDWSPIGAARFLELVECGYYDGAPWFRVIDGFVAQCGIAVDPAMNQRWSEATIKDDPVVQGNLPSFVAFGKTQEPDSRSTHIYINYGDNSRLDAKGFSCFAQVVEGMDVALSLAKVEYDDQEGLAAEGGMARFAEAFPQADYIKSARILSHPD